jgi:putative DNA primase/helicase
MRQDSFEFTPQLKLIIAGNHKPRLNSVNEAMRRRFNLIPFTVKIPESERVADFSKKLVATELPGILSWMIDGCMEWQRRRLDPPKIVTDATEAYLESEDSFKAFLEEAGEYDGSAWESSQDFFAAWVAFANRNGEYVGDQKRFAQNLYNKKIVAVRDGRRGRGFRGFRLFGNLYRETVNHDRG